MLAVVAGGKKLRPVPVCSNMELNPEWFGGLYWCCCRCDEKGEVLKLYGTGREAILPAAG